MRDITIAITAASYSGNKGAAAMLQSSIAQLQERYGGSLNINLMSVYPDEDRMQLPWDFIRVVPCKPEQLLFFAFPLAVFHWLFRWCKPVARLLERNPIIGAYCRTDFVIDEAGISFVDERGVILNTYAFVCAAVPLLLGVPVVKYSQAMGPFKNPVNRFLAKWILPKLRLVVARGEKTLANLHEIGIVDNVKLCADGAFSMRDCADAHERVTCAKEADAAFYSGRVVGMSLSSVVEKKCAKAGIDYRGIMTRFVDSLCEQGYRVLIIANAARINSTKTRNNDLMVCDAVYEGAAHKESIRWAHKEMEAEEIREYIGCCEVLVASRFHAMIAALERKVPVLLVGWSHKYQEVLDMFRLGRYAINYRELSLGSLSQAFEGFMSETDEIRKKLDAYLPAVLKSSHENMELISAELERVLAAQPRKGRFDYRNPDRYLGENVLCRKGYAADEAIRANAASGGMVTALLCNLLERGEIDGAWVTRSVVREGKLDYETLIATTPEEIRGASSSIYMDMPLLKHINMLRQFEGRVAVVLVPCMMAAFQRILSDDEALREKVVLKIGLFCSGSHGEEATLMPIRKLGIPMRDATSFFWRRGHWRGQSAVLYRDGSAKTFSYSKTICAYKNAFFFQKHRCMTCQDHFASWADISFGDIWLRSMKKNPIKHTCCVIRSEHARVLYQGAVDDGAIIDSHISRREMLNGQKRALVFKWHCAAAKKGAKGIDTSEPCKWNHRLAYALAEKNRVFSEKHEALLEKIPMVCVYYYMCFIRVLLSF